MRKTVLITGITGNVGEACRDYADKGGLEVIGVSRSVNFDITDWQIVDAFMRVFPPFDLAILAHGIQKPALLSEIDQDTWREVVSNNLEASAAITHALLKHRKMNPNGLVVYFSSIQASQPRPGRGAYAAAKAGIEGLARAAAVEFAENNVRTVALRLGQLTTAMQGITFSPEQAEAIRTYTPLPWVEPEDIARFIFSLYPMLSLTGEVIEISSGHKFSVWPNGVHNAER